MVKYKIGDCTLCISYIQMYMYFSVQMVILLKYNSACFIQDPKAGASILYGRVSTLDDYLVKMTMLGVIFFTELFLQKYNYHPKLLIG